MQHAPHRSCAIELGGHYSICACDVHGTLASSPVIYGVTLAQWRHMDQQLHANGIFVSKNNKSSSNFVTYHNWTK